MALVPYIKGAFTSGELSPRLLARQDVDRYKNGASKLENWKVLPQGGVQRREGTRYIATTKFPEALTLVRPFEPSSTDAYVLEVGHLYLRFYKNTARIESPPGTAVEVVTPYTEAQLRQIRTAQSNNVMILVHGSHAPRQLSRLSDTSWQFNPVPFRPPPLFEAGYVGGTNLTLSATTGQITITASASFFLPGDVGRQITSGLGRATIISYTSGTSITAQVVQAFSSTSLTSGNWELKGSPVAELTPSVTGPVGAEVTVTLGISQPSASNLVTNGSFTDLSSWVDLSHPTLVSGAHDGANNSQFLLQDSGEDFTSLGVLPTQTVFNGTDGSQGVISSVGTVTILVGDPGMVGGAENDFDTGDTYTVIATGYATASGGMAHLHGGTAGYGWLSQAITTVAGTTYEATFDVGAGTIGFMVGTAQGSADLKPETSYPSGANRTQFTASGTATYISFRNNQNFLAGFTNVAVRPFGIAGFRPADAGTYVRVHDGLILLHTFTNSSTMVGEILRELDTDDPAAAGAWELLVPAWSDTYGYPTDVLLYEGRLYFFSTARFPKTVWASAVDDLFNFAIGPNPEDALEFLLTSSGGNITLDAIQWAMPSENILYGTTHGLYRLIGAGDDPLTPTSPPRNRSQDAPGASFVKPVKVGGAILYAQRQGSSILEILSSENVASAFNARDITVTSDHLFRQYRPLEFAYSPEPSNLVWIVRSDGAAVAVTHNLREEIRAWWRFTTPGTVDSMAVIPHPTANHHQTWLSVRRSIGATITGFIEVLDPDAVMELVTPVDQENELTGDVETISGWSGLTVDAATVYSGAATDTIAVPHLIGMTVSIVGDGAIFPDQVVPGSGFVVLPQAVSTAWVGLFYFSQGRCLPVEAALQGNTGQWNKKRWVNLTARVEGTACLVLGGERINFRQPSHLMDQGTVPFSGDKEVTLLGWDRMGMVDFLVDQPLPALLVGIFGLLEAETVR